ncbi:MAG: KOW domain-containing RNA-binding protein [Oscillospiraceae bacterium]|nr:KOW domain-containing RNA-binding protein [Oscillospiraceae bacterium]MBQ9111129.1 KOW domain-containing RNA-binding protein [Oscillospiraceae bacterium]
MQLQVGMVVCAAAGKEKDNYYIVTGIDGRFVTLADGKHRTLEKPKRKNVRHIRLTGTVWELEGLTDKALRRRLRECNAEQGGN